MPRSPLRAIRGLRRPISGSEARRYPPTAGSMVLRDAAGLVADSLNYGGLVDPWAAEGYQATSGAGQSGCRVASPGPGLGPPDPPRRSTGARAASRTASTPDSNCADFLLQPVTTLSAASAAGASNIKVAGVADFAPGQTIMIDTGANLETAVIATVGTAGATTISAATNAGRDGYPGRQRGGFQLGAEHRHRQRREPRNGGCRSLSPAAEEAPQSPLSPLTLAHAAGAQVSGTGITLAGALTRAHVERSSGCERCSHARRAQPVLQKRSLKPSRRRANWARACRHGQ